MQRGPRFWDRRESAITLVGGDVGLIAFHAPHQTQNSSLQLGSGFFNPSTIPLKGRWGAIHQACYIIHVGFLLKLRLEYGHLEPREQSLNHDNGPNITNLVCIVYIRVLDIHLERSADTFRDQRKDERYDCKEHSSLVSNLLRSRIILQCE